MSCIPINDFSLITLCDATKAGKLYSIVPDTGAGDFDVVRATTATYLGSDGLLKTAANNEPRIEFNPDGSYKGLLVEPAATNLLLRSEEFDDAYWTKNGATITADDETAPDGTMTADKVTLTDSTGRVQKSISLDADTEFTLSSFVKNIDAENSLIALLCINNANTVCFGTFELTGDGSVTNQGNAVATITPFENGWYRCSITFNSESGASSPRVRVVSNETVDSGFTTGQSVFLWGAQLEESTAPTSYIPTVASTVTRAADSISKTGASALIGQTEGTIYAEVSFAGGLSIGQGRIILSISDETDNNRVILFIDNNSLIIRGFIRASGTLVFDNGASFENVTIAKIAIAYKSGDYALYVNGSLAASGTTAFSFATTLNQVAIGQRHNFINQLNDHIKAAALLPTRLSNAQLEALTTI